MSPLLAVMQAGIGRQSRKRLEIECQEGPVVRQLSQIKTYKEDPIRRNIRPTFFDLLELSRLSANFDQECIPAIGRNAQIYMGTECMERPSRDHPSKLRVDDIEVKVRLVSADCAVQTLVCRPPRWTVGGSSPVLP
jgi:hypothetical protein